MTSPEKNTTDRRICIGKISSSHGVRGLVKIIPFCEDTSLLNGTLFTDKTGNDTLDITLKNSLGKSILAHIDGVTTPEQAKLLKCSLFVPRETLPEIKDDDEFYIEDLANLNVIKPDGEQIGTVITVQNYGAGDLLEIKPKSGASFFVPFQDEYIRDINLDEKYVTVENADRFLIE
ncbi:MAG: 16S rRNA processing protein RimM [Alphaproteobacteria bacterium]|nr:MAG: 16S rRNA processing protein RimM [Alphaproteobacteria bacterium]